MGQQQRDQGAAAEKEIQDAIAFYGPDRVLAQHLPVMMRKRGGNYFHARPSPFDFMGAARVEPAGTLTFTGKGILYPLAIECKSNGTAKGTLAINEKGSGVSPHQLEALRAWVALGGIGMIAWRNGDEWLRLHGEDLAGVATTFFELGRDAYKSIPARLFEAMPLMPGPWLGFLEEL